MVSIACKRANEIIKPPLMRKIFSCKDLWHLVTLYEILWQNFKSSILWVFLFYDRVGGLYLLPLLFQIKVVGLLPPPPPPLLSGIPVNQFSNLHVFESRLRDSLVYRYHLVFDWFLSFTTYVIHLVYLKVWLRCSCFQFQMTITIDNGLWCHLVDIYMMGNLCS